MDSCATEMKMQMQPLLSDLHRFMANCVKTNAANEGSSDLIVLLPAASHKPRLKYFGQNKVDAAVAKVSKSTRGPVTVPPRLSPFQPKSDHNHKTGDSAGNLHIDFLNQVEQKLRGLSEVWENTLGHSVYDMYENLSPMNGIPLPATLPENWEAPPGLEPVAPEILSMIKVGNDDYNAHSQLSTCDVTPASPYKSGSRKVQNSPIHTEASPKYSHMDQIFGQNQFCGLPVEGQDLGVLQMVY